jgi:dTDP-4-dehydrorhamnose 3,5-epimerase-like enzyme
MPEKNNSHKTSHLSQCHIIELQRHRHANGSLTVVENTEEFPFAVKRAFYLYDVPGDSERGGHSHHQAQELIMAVSGAFDVTLSDGHESRTFTLNRPYNALYIPAGIWRGLNNFSSGSVCLVLTSETYSEEDYVRDINEFHRLTAEKES